MDLSPFYDGHGPEVLLPSGFIGESPIAAGDLDTVMPHKLLKRHQTHPPVEKLTGIGMSQRVQTIAPMGQASRLKVFLEHHRGTGIAQSASCSAVEEKRCHGVALAQPCPQGLPGIVTEIDHTTSTVLSSLKDRNGLLVHVEVARASR